MTPAEKKGASGATNRFFFIVLVRRMHDNAFTTFSILF